LGNKNFAQIWVNVAELDAQQTAWKLAPRINSSFTEKRCPRGRQGIASDKQCSMRRRHPIRRHLDWLRRLGYGLKQTWRFAISQQYRSQMGCQWIAWRIEAWEERRFLSGENSIRIINSSQSQDVASYITDFSMHLAIQLVLRLCRWFVVPAALLAGLINPTIAGGFLFAGGAISRTLYTLCRSLQSLSHRQPVPWIALLTGTMPVFGNLAYPLQLLYLSRQDGGELAQFVVCDSLASLGRAIPIWGGRDSLTEHSFNRLAVGVNRIAGKAHIE